MLQAIGSITGFDVAVSRPSEHYACASFAWGNVLLPDGFNCMYHAASISFDPQDFRQVRAFLVDSNLAAREQRSSAGGSLALWVDFDATTPRGVYPGGLIVAGVVDIPAAGTLASGQASTIAKPLGTRERTTLLCIIGALAEHAKLDLSQPMKAGGVIAKMLPDDVQLSARTIGEHLKDAREAIGAKRG